MSIQAQLDYVRNFGLIVNNIISDAKLHRVPTVDKPLSKNGYYVSHENGIFMGNWATGQKEFFSTSTGKLTKFDWDKINQAKEQAKVKKRKAQAKAAIDAQAMFTKAQAVKSHPYLTRKGVNPTELMRVSYNELYIPLYDLWSMEIKNIQRIKPNGEKRYLTGGKVKGLCFVINQPKTRLMFNDGDTIYLAEGVATALTVAEQSDCYTLACMNAGNLLPVATQIRKNFPTANIIISGDNDYKTSLKTGKNTGINKAKECAEAINASVSFPPLTQTQLESGLSDWNDYVQALREVAND